MPACSRACCIFHNVVFVYSFAIMSQKEHSGEEDGYLTYPWLIILVFLIAFYGVLTS